MNKEITRLILFIVSRPIFYNLFSSVNKICLYAMNRVSASFLDCEVSGEREALEWILKKLSDRSKEIIVFDCGGHYGEYSSMLLSTIDRLKIENKIAIHVFEPSSFCMSILTDKFSNTASINLHQNAIANENKQAELYFPWTGSSGASLSSNVANAQMPSKSLVLESEQIEAVTLDSFCKKNGIGSIGYLKLDIEGYELDALKGGREMLANDRIAYIQVEIGPASLATKSTLFDIYNLLAVNYKFHLVLNHGLVEIHEYKPDLECFYGASNFILENKSFHD